MPRKFSLLPVGQRFTYQGIRYIKVSPLIASAEDGGGQRMIPRSAMVEAPADDEPPRAEESPAPLSGEEVITAFDASRDWLLAQLPAPAEKLAALLAEQRQRFLDALPIGNEKH